MREAWYGPEIPMENDFRSNRFRQNPAVLVGNISESLTDWLTIYDSRLALEMNVRQFFFEQPPSEKASMDPQKIQSKGRHNVGPSQPSTQSHHSRN